MGSIVQDSFFPVLSLNLSFFKHFLSVHSELWNFKFCYHILQKKNLAGFVDASCRQIIISIGCSQECSHCLIYFTCLRSIGFQIHLCLPTC